MTQQKNDDFLALIWPGESYEALEPHHKVVLRKNSKLCNWLRLSQAKEWGMSAEVFAKLESHHCNALQDDELRQWLLSDDAKAWGMDNEFFTRLRFYHCNALKDNELRQWLVSAEAKKWGMDKQFFAKLELHHCNALKDDELRQWLVSAEAKKWGMDKQFFAKLEFFHLVAFKHDTLRQWLLSDDAKAWGMDNEFFTRLESHHCDALKDGELRQWMLSKELTAWGMKAGAFASLSKYVMDKLCHNKELREWLISPERKQFNGINATLEQAVYFYEIKHLIPLIEKRGYQLTDITTSPDGSALYTLTIDDKEIGASKAFLELFKSDEKITFLEKLNKALTDSDSWLPGISTANSDRIKALLSLDDELRQWLVSAEAKKWGMDKQFFAKLEFFHLVVFKHDTLRQWLLSDDAKAWGMDNEFFFRLKSHHYDALKDGELRQWLLSEGGKAWVEKAETFASLSKYVMDKLCHNKELREWLLSQKRELCEGFNATLEQAVYFYEIKHLIPLIEKRGYQLTDITTSPDGSALYTLKIGDKEIGASKAFLELFENDQQFSSISELNERLTGTDSLLASISCANKDRIDALLKLKKDNDQNYNHIIATFKAEQEKGLDFGQEWGAFSDVLGKYTMGVEVECFNFPKDDINLLITWLLGAVENTTDGSIKGPSGIEFVSPVLKNENDVYEFLKCIRFVQSKGAQVNESCGLHVHVGFQNLETPEEWLTPPGYKNRKNVGDNEYPITPFQFEVIKQFLIMYYNHAELGMDTYSRGTLETIQTIDDTVLANIQSAYNVDDLLDLFNNDRHLKVNPFSLIKHGTIEVRHHKGTVDPSNIYDWMQTIGKMLNKAEEKVVANGLSHTTEGEQEDVANGVPQLTEGEQEDVAKGGPQLTEGEQEGGVNWVSLLQEQVNSRGLASSNDQQALQTRSAMAAGAARDALEVHGHITNLAARQALRAARDNLKPPRH